LLDRPEDDEEVLGQLTEILDNIAAESNVEEPTWNEVFSNATKSRNLQRVLLGMGPYMMNQWSGKSLFSFGCALPPVTITNVSHRHQCPLLLPRVHPSRIP
jgi:hypothetical protein